MKVGRKPSIEPKTAWRVYVPDTLAAQVELLLYDPLREKLRYGSRNELIVALITRWLQETKERVAQTQGDIHVKVEEGERNE